VRSSCPTRTTITTTITEHVAVALDANGADAGPAEVVRGAIAAVEADPGIRVLVFGPADGMPAVPDRVELIDAPVSVAKAADPVRAVRETPEASIVQAVIAVADDRADALVSGGSTAAALAAGVLRIKRMRGVHRPALALLMPVPGNPFLLLDVGANVDVRPEHLVQFAHMGRAFMHAVMGIDAPRVALLSNGTEAIKGTETIVAARAALEGSPGFVGSVEAFTIAGGEADVVVTDGFTGNVMLKTMEGTSKALLDAIRGAAMSSPRAKAGGLLLRPALGGLRDSIDPELQGGAIMLGLRKLGVVPHGSFSARGIARAVEVAARGVRTDLVGSTHAALEAAGALRSAPAGTVDAP
jgi:glycerol-3-phosphate acyltransferase PlsX